MLGFPEGRTGTDGMDANDELQALWTTLFGEPPFIRAEATVMAQVLVSAMPPAPPYRPSAATSSEDLAPAADLSGVYVRAARG